MNKSKTNSENIIDFPQKESKKLEQLKKVKNFVGAVPSKSTLRKMPNVKVGEIYWIELDNEGYIVADIKDGYLTLKALDEYASISMGISVYEANKKINSKEPLTNESQEELAKKFETFVKNNQDTTFILYSRDIHYFTLFQKDSGAKYYLFVDCLHNIGDIISIDATKEGDRLEIWLRTEDNPAILLYLLPFDKGIVEY